MNAFQAKRQALHEQITRELSANADFIFGHPEHFNVVDFTPGELLEKPFKPSHLTFFKVRHPETGNIMSRVAALKILNETEAPSVVTEYYVYFHMDGKGASFFADKNGDYLLMPDAFWQKVIDLTSFFLATIQD